MAYFSDRQQLSLRCGAAQTRGSCFTAAPRLLAAALILLINSRAISGMREETSAGLATKSNAPSAKALNVTEAPSLLCELTTITGRRCRRMISFNMSRPFHARHFQIEGHNLGAAAPPSFSTQKFPSMAVPTTSMEVSVLRICGNQLTHQRGVIHYQNADRGTHCLTSVTAGADMARSAWGKQQPGRKFSHVIKAVFIGTLQLRKLD